MSHKKLAIAQPTFLPWVGWFDLADQVDLFIVLDDVGFSKQSWQQRNRIRTQNGLEFLTVPVKTSGRLGQAIAECELVDQSFTVKMAKSLRTNYAKAAYFQNTFDEVVTILQTAARTNRLVELNCALISWMAERLGVTTEMVRASKLGVGGERGEHVAALCECVGADCYLSPAGAESYLVEDKHSFERRGIEVLIHVYEHPVYSQRFAPFIPFASALDLIFNLGPAAGEVMRSGRRSARAVSNDIQKGEEVDYEN
ncbi:MAG: WbqC family protein [Desulforhopalus sp.]|nr:WbqC family protein [Desulforhopalus sp.]